VFHMIASSRELVSPARFIELMNEKLRLAPAYQQAMQFIDLGTGYDLLAPTLDTTANQSLDKTIFDKVSLKYTIAH